jgi:hypothetical protein
VGFGIGWLLGAIAEATDFDRLTTLPINALASSIDCAVQWALLLLQRLNCMTNLIQKFLGFIRLSIEQPQTKAFAQDLETGGLYSVVRDSDKNTYGIVKILVLAPPDVHLRVYANTFASRPEEVNSSALSLGAISLTDLGNDAQGVDMAGLGIGHLPLSLQDFIHGWQPVFLESSFVTEDELEGYRYWKEDGGGVFGSF